MQFLQVRFVVSLNSLDKTMRQIRIAVREKFSVYPRK